MEFHKVSRFYEQHPLKLYNSENETQSQKLFTPRFFTILEKSVIQPCLMGVLQKSSSLVHHVFEYVGLLAVLIH